MIEDEFIDRMIDFAIADLRRYKRYRFHLKHRWLRFFPFGIGDMWILTLWKGCLSNAKQNIDAIYLLRNKK